MMNAVRRKQDRGVGSTVNLMQGEYLDNARDMFIKVPGHTLEVTRRFYDDQWHFDHLARNLEIVYGTEGKKPDYIVRDRVIYEKADDAGTVFSFKDDRRIFVKEDGYLWKDNDGNWSEFDLTGKMLKFGNRNNLKVSLIYEDGENGRLVGVADHFDNQVLWYEYDAEGNIFAVQDAEGRRVEYIYESGKLATVRDLLKNETHFEYDDEGRLEIKKEPNGKILTISYNDHGYVSSVKDQNDEGPIFDYDYDDSAEEYYAEIITDTGKIIEKRFDRTRSMGTRTGGITGDSGDCFEH
ncbi:MAG: hypothetical protein GY795_04445 [Desulfobacterales bacterium]|nr:hypothetical protein [Desulfobacterales bacterium]